MVIAGDLTGDGYALQEPIAALDPYYGEVLQRIAYLYSLNTTVNVNVVGTGGNLASITDNRMIAGAMETRTAAQGGFASEANTPNISSILGGTYDRINTTESASPPALPVDTDLHRFPIFLSPDVAGSVQSMDLADCVEFFIQPAIANITSGTVAANAGGAYHISTSTSVAGSTLQSATPVFTDTRANAALYTSGGIEETYDQPTTVNNYYLHKITPAANTPQFMPVYWDYTAGDFREMPLSMFDDIFGPMIQNMAVNGSGVVGFDTKITYNVNGTGNTMGTVMADTRLSGSSASGYTQRFVSTSDYRTQEFPNGTPTTNQSHRLRTTVTAT